MSFLFLKESKRNFLLFFFSVSSSSLFHFTNRIAFQDCFRHQNTRHSFPLSFRMRAISTCGNNQILKSSASFSSLSKHEEHKIKSNLPLKSCTDIFTPPSNLFPLISTEQLNEALKNEKYAKCLRFVDCTWMQPTTFMKRNAKELDEIERIEDAVHFDLDECCDKSSIYAHMLPSPYEFAVYIDKMFSSRLSASSSLPFKDKEDEIVEHNEAVSMNKHHIVFYDSKGIFSSPRVWFTFKLFGYNNISVLDGGLAKWISEGRRVSRKDHLLKNEGDVTKAAQEKQEQQNQEAAVTQRDKQGAADFCGDESKTAGGKMEKAQNEEATSSSSSSNCSSTLFPSATSSSGSSPSFSSLGGSCSSAQVSRLLPAVSPNTHFVSSYEDVENALKKYAEGQHIQNLKRIIDARSPERFFSPLPEVVVQNCNDITLAHIPHSANIPFSSLLNEHIFSSASLAIKNNHEASKLFPLSTYTTFKTKENLQAIFNSYNLLKDQEIICTCGSGVTACILFLALYICGFDINKLSVYDGSWNEYIQRKQKK